MTSSFAKKVYQLIKQVPKRRVTTYKSITQALNCKAYQAVGNALRHNPYTPQVPCHRVIKSNGAIGGFNGKKKGQEIKNKQQLLKNEGIKINKNQIQNFKKILFKIKPLHPPPNH